MSQAYTIKPMKKCSSVSPTRFTTGTTIKSNRSMQKVPKLDSQVDQYSGKPGIQQMPLDHSPSAIYQSFSYLGSKNNRASIPVSGRSDVSNTVYDFKGCRPQTGNMRQQ